MRKTNLTIWVMVVVLNFGSSKTEAVVFNDVLTHNINYEVNDS